MRRKGRAIDGWRFAALALLILALGIILRTSLLHYQGLYEPDGFFDYAVMQQAVSNHFSVGTTMSLSGFPQHNLIGEPAGEYYLTLAPYYLLQYFGVSILQLMRLMAVLFGILYMLLVYPLTKMLTKSRAAALLSVFFLAISSGSIARTAATIYRGDVFAPLFVILSIIILYKSFSSDSLIKKFAFASISAIILSLSISVWNGAAFAFAIYDLALLLLTAVFFIRGDKTGARSAVIASLSYIFAYFGEGLVLYSGLSTNLHVQLAGPSFLPIYAAIVAISGISFLLLRSRGFMRRFKSQRARLLLAASIAIALLLIIYLIFNSYVNHIISGAVTNAGFINATTDELQPISFNFLLSSFAFQLFFAPAGVLLFLYACLKEKYDRAALTGFALLLSYLIVTAVLQSQAIRYNSLLSVPMAVFSGYAIYKGASLMHGKKVAVSRSGRQKLPVLSLYYGFVTSLIILSVGISFLVYATSAPADAIGPAFLSAMEWMGANTAANSTVITLWPDGSVVEGWAHRQSYTDSVGGENYSRVQQFASFISNGTGSMQYLYNIHQPDYLVERYLWLDEGAAIAYESGSSNVLGYIYDPMTISNISSSSYIFDSGNPLFNYSATVSFSKMVPLYHTYGFVPASIIYYNSSNGAYNISDTGQDSGLSLLVYRNGTDGARNGTGSVPITGMAVIGNQLMESNMFHLLLFCGAACSIGNASFSLVFSNNDTKIYHIAYGAANITR
jgi:asparagine N-glycosylation enzyme membrane subunit Stt3